MDFGNLTCSGFWPLTLVIVGSFDWVLACLADDWATRLRFFFAVHDFGAEKQQQVSTGAVLVNSKVGDSNRHHWSVMHAGVAG